MVVSALLFVAGLSEAAGRLLPLVARRHEVSKRLLLGLLVAGALVEGAVFGLWPLTASTIAGQAPGAGNRVGGLAWTPALIAPLVLAGVLAFPLLGPMLHLVLLLGVGASLVDPLAAATGLEWGSAATCVALAGVGLASVVAAVRRLVATLIAAGIPEPAG